MPAGIFRLDATLRFAHKRKSSPIDNEITNEIEADIGLQKQTENPSFLLFLLLIEDYVKGNDKAR